MDIWQTILVVLRRWYVSLPAFALSILLALAVWATAPKVYQSTTVLVLMLPPSGASQSADPDRTPDQTNPLLNFDRGLSISATILIEALRDPGIAAQLGVAPSGKTWYEVTNGSTNPELLITGPFVFVQGSSDTPEGAREIVAKVTERAKVELGSRQRQVNAPSSTFISAIEVVPPTTPAAHGGSRIRAAAAAGVLGVLAALVATFGFESAMSARTRRRAGAARPTRSGSPTLEPSASG
ncbi:hypothetical protein [Actinokineospora sp.]|uniref:hypothetical protein n=1 Tax=Actinokineospora sp. TaxID=1872133 RepID=UPI003D6B300E